MRTRLGGQGRGAGVHGGGAGRERVGLGGEPVVPLLCVGKREKGAGRFSHHVNRSQANSQMKGRRRRWSSTTTGRAALWRDRGTAHEGVEGANLWHGRLSERRRKHQRGRKREKGESFTGDELPRRRRRRQSVGAGEIGALARG
jgi:hypothetical protein